MDALVAATAAAAVVVAAGGWGERPCDIFAAGGTPCVAAHSVVRALYGNYTGPLYTVSRGSDNATLDVEVVPGTGIADAAAQRTFCTVPRVTICTTERIWDQSGRGNHLERVRVTSGNVHGWPTAGINSMRDELTVGGHQVYSAYFEGGQDNDPGTDSGTMGFRSNRINGNASGTAIGDEPETIYMVTSGTHYNEGCCFDYGNSEVVACGRPGGEPCIYLHRCQYAYGFQHAYLPNQGDQDFTMALGKSDRNDPACAGCGKMEAINWSAQRPDASDPAKGVNHVGIGKGPWVMADLESGVWAGSNVGVTETNFPFNESKFVTAILKGNSGNHWSLKAGDAQAGALKVLFDGERPPHYNPMVKQGAIVLGIGGDNSDFGIGTFYEGALTASYTSDVTDAAIHANIVAAGYGA